jgi:hypothetical protein
MRLPIRVNLKSVLIVFMLMCILGGASVAEVKSGFCICPNPISLQDSAGFIDFSLLDPTAPQPLSLDAEARPDMPDVYFKGANIITPNRHRRRIHYLLPPLVI